MITIVNVDKNLRRTGVHEYEVRVNRKPLFRFKHPRENSLASLLGRAHQAAWDAEGREMCELIDALGERKRLLKEANETQR